MEGLRMKFKRHTKIKTDNFGKMGKKNQWKIELLNGYLFNEKKKNE